MVAAEWSRSSATGPTKIIARLAEANDLKGVIDVADFNDADKLGKGHVMVDRLTERVGISRGLDFDQNRVAVHTAHTSRVDPKVVGVEHQTESGMVDFHTLCMTCLSKQVASGASVKVCQTLAWYSTSSLTIND